VIDESRAPGSRLADATGIAFVDHERCNVLLALRRLDEAERTCGEAETELVAVGRADQAAGTLSQLARIDLLHGRNGAALARLDRALVDDGRLVPPTFLARLYAVRSEALAALGRSADALRDLKDSIRVTELADQQRCSLAVAVPPCALFICLLVASRRHARELRRQETILRKTSEYAPDALLPLETRPAIEAALTRLFDQRQAVSFEAGQLIGATLRLIEVTDVRRLEREVIDVANRERQRLGAELHDGLGQELTGISMLLQTVAAQIPRGAAGAGGTVNEAIAHLTSAIAEQALGNAVLRGRCSNVEIELRREVDRLLVTITDDGAGMPEPPLGVRDQDEIGLVGLEAHRDACDERRHAARR
jgi:signal transduction histidine kinase